MSLFDIDSLLACVRVEINSYKEIVPLFDIDSLLACVRVEINS